MAFKTLYGAILYSQLANALGEFYSMRFFFFQNFYVIKIGFLQGAVKSELFAVSILSKVSFYHLQRGRIVIDTKSC